MHGSEQTYWSPYQKLELKEIGDQQYHIAVNNTGYMNIANLTADFLRKNPQIAQRLQEDSMTRLSASLQTAAGS